MAEFCGDVRVNYAQDESIFATGNIRIWLSVLGCLFAMLPFIANQYFLHLAITVGIAIIAAIGINIITGFTGMISLGHGAFVGVGAYATAILSDRVGIPLIIMLPLAGLASSIFGIIFGLPSLRIKGLYLLMATLAAQVILNFLMINWASLTKGVYGYTVVPPSIFGFSLGSTMKSYWLVYFMVIIALFSAKNLFRTRYGRAFIAIRDRDIAADVIGVNLVKYKILSFAVGSFYAGVAGALMAYYNGVITPENFPLSLSIEYLAIIIVGGLGSIMGSVYGASFIIILLPEILNFLLEWLSKFIPGAIDHFPHYREILFGMIIIFFLIFEPDGLAEIHRRIKKYFKLWPFATN